MPTLSNVEYILIKCEPCNRIFITIQAWIEHKIYVHQPEEETLEEIECKSCNRRFTTIKEWIDHKIPLTRREPRPQEENESQQDLNQET